MDVIFHHIRFEIHITAYKLKDFGEPPRFGCPLDGFGFNDRREFMEQSPGRIKVLEEKRRLLDEKYARAVEMYRTTDLSLCRIAKACGVSVSGLGAYMRRHQRELVFRRHHVPVTDKDLRSVKLIAAGKQSLLAHEKYKDAVYACDSLENIALNVSQIARKYHLDGQCCPK